MSDKNISLDIEQVKNLIESVSKFPESKPEMVLEGSPVEPDFSDRTRRSHHLGGHGR